MIAFEYEVGTMAREIATGRAPTLAAAKRRASAALAKLRADGWVSHGAAVFAVDSEGKRAALPLCSRGPQTRWQAWRTI